MYNEYRIGPGTDPRGTYHQSSRTVSVVEVGFKPFQDLFSETKAIAQSIQEKSVINGVKCTGHAQQKDFTARILRSVMLKILKVLRYNTKSSIKQIFWTSDYSNMIITVPWSSSSLEVR